MANLRDILLQNLRRLRDYGWSLGHVMDCDLFRVSHAGNVFDFVRYMSLYTQLH